MPTSPNIILSPKHRTSMSEFNQRYTDGRGDVPRSRYLRVIDDGLQREEWKGNCDNKMTSQDPLDGRFGTLQSSEPGYPEDRPLGNHLKIPQEVNNSICEALKCSSPAEVKIEVKVGNLGNIPLSLCKDCVSKFRNEEA